MNKPNLHCSVCGQRTEHRVVSERESIQGSPFKGTDCLATAQVLACSRCREETFRVVRAPATAGGGARGGGRP